VAERPILFSAPLVRAILAGDKTVTRRPVKPSNSTCGSERWPNLNFDDSQVRRWGDVAPNAQHLSVAYGGPDPDWAETRHRVHCRIEPGDHLWVREAFCVENQVIEVGNHPPHDDGRPICWNGDDESGRWWEQPHYRATDDPPELVLPGSDEPGVRWRPSIHMPRWASRITLEVIGVAVERLWDITEEQALAEGVLHEPGFAPDFDADWLPRTPARAAFANAWQGMYARRPGLSWHENPWVWALNFRRIRP